MRQPARALLGALPFLLLATPTAAQTTATNDPSSQPTGTTTASTSTSRGTLPPLPTGTSPPDVLLRVPELHVGKIELDVDDLRADVNLNADIANLVSLNVGVQVGVSRVNITIADVDAQLDLVVRLGHLAQMVNRTLATLDLNPLLVNLLNEVGDVVGGVVGAVDGLLGSIVRGDVRLDFLIDNLGNIVQQTVGEGGDVVSTIVGNYEQNMTDTGVSRNLGNGLTEKTYRYDALGSLVNIILNAAGQVVQAVVVGRDDSGDGSSSAAPTATASASNASSAAGTTGTATHTAADTATAGTGTASATTA